MSDLQSNQISSFTKGINASASKTNQPPQSVPRASNLVLTRRGSLITCDGSQILFAFNGAPQANSGKFLVITLFQPTGVSNYYLALVQTLGLSIGAPQNLTVVTAAGGTLPAATYYYKVTAIDGAGGETLAYAEVSVVTGANGQNTLTWNVVPNAAGYNIYRSTFSGGEILLSGVGLPVPQVTIGSLTASFVDTGVDASMSYTLTSAVINSVTLAGLNYGYSATFTVPTTVGLSAGQNFNLVGGSNGFFDVPTWNIRGIISSTQFTAHFIGANSSFTHLSPGSTTTGGTFTTGNTPPLNDTTQQIALIKMPIIPGVPATLPVSYNNSNIVALFPATLTTFTTAGGAGGGGGGGGSTGGGGTSGGGGTGGTGGGKGFL